MDLLESILGANDGKAVAEIARKVGIPESMAQKGAAALAPALQRGLQRNSRKQGGAEALLGALKTGNHARYVDDPATLEKEDTIADGNKILGHIFGNKDVSRNVAGQAAGSSDIDAGLLKKVLPLLGTVAMGALAKNTLGGSGGGSNPLGALSGMLGGAGADDGGSAADEILDLARKSSSDRTLRRRPSWHGLKIPAPASITKRRDAARLSSSCRAGARASTNLRRCGRPWRRTIA